MSNLLAIGYEREEQLNRAIELATRLQLPIDNQAKQQLFVAVDKLQLKIYPFLPMEANFSRQFWQPRRDAGKKQGIVRACKPGIGMQIIDATAGWGRDAAVLASFGADVLMLERNPIIAELLNDALLRQDAQSKVNLKLNVCYQEAHSYINALLPEQYPDVIYIDPMHPIRHKTALVKKDLQALQYLVNEKGEGAIELVALSKKRVKQRVVVKWPANQPPLLAPNLSITGKTVRFDIYLPER